MKLFIYFFLGLFFAASCYLEGEKSIVRTVDSTLQGNMLDSLGTDSVRKIETNAIKIRNTGPRGGAYLSNGGESFRYTIFRIQIFNDSVLPVNVNLHFPVSELKLIPDTNVRISVFLIPDDYTPHELLDQYNFGVSLEDYFEDGINFLVNKSATIESNTSLDFYIAILLNSGGNNGPTRAKLHFEGSDNEAPFFSVDSTTQYKMLYNPVNLMFSIAMDPPKNFTSFLCGQIYFN